MYFSLLHENDKIKSAIICMYTVDPIQIYINVCISCIILKRLYKIAFGF